MMMRGRVWLLARNDVERARIISERAMRTAFEIEDRGLQAGVKGDFNSAMRFLYASKCLRNISAVVYVAINYYRKRYSR